MSLFPPTCAAEFHERVACLCALHHASVTGGHRTPARNANVGGVGNSLHLWHTPGWAADVEVDSRQPADRERLAEAARVLGLQAIVENEKNHVHLQVHYPQA